MRQRPNSRRLSQRLHLKRMLDIVVSAVGIVVLSPVLLFIAVAVKVTSPGPVLYLGVRTGRGGRPFHIYKFRSMVTNAEQVGGTTTGLNDNRITPIGKFIRQYKLDELPQLFNVLRGDMSLVGPRPEVAEYTDAYTPSEQRILSVRPGITDLSSLRFNDLQSVVGTEDPDEVFRREVLPEKIRLRLKYVDEQSFRGDLGIIAKTAGVVLAKPLKSSKTEKKAA